MIPEVQWKQLFNDMDEVIKQIQNMRYETMATIRELKGESE